MIIARRHLLCSGLALACAPLLSFSPPAAAQPPGGLGGTEGAQVRLLAGTATGDMVRAGLEIRLAPGWKTYWRYPGDSGVPPRFDWTGSTNVADVTVLWPAPMRFDDGAGGTSIGYKGTVILPLEVRLKAPGQPAELKLALDYAVCESLCVPADARLDATLPGTGAEDPLLAEARRRVPADAALGAPGTPAILKLEMDGATTPPRVIVTTRAAKGANLFLEGPDDLWALPLPEPVGSEGDIQRFAAKLLGVPADTNPAGARLTLTLVDGGHAIQTRADLPPPGTTP
ncbi:protein-disulfide reductase DsbD domain-containing protein [Xanthobacteraceae bacterium A53D]